MTKQRIYKTFICPHCGKKFKENAWWRHGVGRCVSKSPPDKAINPTPDTVTSGKVTPATLGES